MDNPLIEEMIIDVRTRLGNKQIDKTNAAGPILRTLPHGRNGWRPGGRKFAPKGGCIRAVLRHSGLYGDWYSDASAASQRGHRADVRDLE